MRIYQFWQRFRPTRKRLNAAASGRRNRSHLAVQNLEGREVPTVLTLDLNTLPYGNDGVADAILARRNDDNVELVVNGQLENSVPLIELTGLRILGSSDVDSITVASDLGLKVFVDGRGGANNFNLRGTPGDDTVRAGGMFRSAIQDDPFFNIGGPNGLTYSIIIEIPSSQAAPSSLIGVWVSTEFQGAQIDRSIDGGAGNDVLTILSPLSFPVKFEGGSGSDMLVGIQNRANRFAIMGPNTGSLDHYDSSVVHFTGLESLVGGNLDDEFHSYVTGENDMELDGKGSTGDIYLMQDYTNAAPVTVNLAAGTATGFDRGIRGIEHVQGGPGDDILIGNSLDNRLDGGGGSDIVFGGGGNDDLHGGAGQDVLLGGAGDDRLVGGAGRDILIGGMGGDRIEGGTDDDLLIGGATTFDDNLPVLNGMRDIWGNTRLSYPQRIDYLRTVGVGGFRLDSSNILPDGAIDWLVGGTGRDWFWTDSLDFLADRSPPEWVN